MMIVRDNPGALGISLGATLAVASAAWLSGALRGSISAIRDLQSGVDLLPPVTPVGNRDTIARPLGIETERTYGPDGHDDRRKVSVDLAWQQSGSSQELKRAVVDGLVPGGNLNSLRSDLKLTPPDGPSARVDALGRAHSKIDAEQARRLPLRRPDRPRTRPAVAAAAVGLSVVFGGVIIPATVSSAELPEIGSSASSPGVADEAQDLNEMFLEILDAADEYKAGSSGLVRRIWGTVGSGAYGTFHDPETGRDFDVNSYDLEPKPDTSSLEKSAGTFSLADRQIPDFVEMAAQVSGQVDVEPLTEVRIDAIDLEAPAPAAADIEFTFGEFGSGEIDIFGRLDGTIAPLWDQDDMELTRTQIATTLAEVGYADAALVSVLIVRTDDWGFETLEPPSGSISSSMTGQSGGFAIDLLDGDELVRIEQPYGGFALVEEPRPVSSTPLTFTVDDIDANALDEVIEAHDSASNAELADEASRYVQISRGITDEEYSDLQAAGKDPYTLDVPIRYLVGYGDADGAIYDADGEPSSGL